MNIKIDSLNKTILKCKKCPRLVNFVKKISTEKRKQNINETYWGKPVTGFGTIYAKILIIGLAPAAHGGTSKQSGNLNYKWIKQAWHPSMQMICRWMT